MSRKIPYVGVTGICSRSEFETLCEKIDKNLTSPHYMFGILVSDRTLRGERNSHPNRYPEITGISEVPVKRPLVKTIVHYHTQAQEHLLVDLLAITQIFQGAKPRELSALAGFQLNVMWPQVSTLEKFFRLLDLKGVNRPIIILQVGPGIMAEQGVSPDEIARTLTPYEGFVDYVLLDPSDGRGKPLNVRLTREFIEAIYATETTFGVGIAGGLSEFSFDKEEITDLIQDFDISVDAEGRLRDDKGHFDVAKASRYLRRAAKAYFSHQ